MTRTATVTESSENSSNFLLDLNSIMEYDWSMNKDLAASIKLDLDQCAKELEVLEKRLREIQKKRDALADRKNTLQRAYDLYAGTQSEPSEVPSANGFASLTIADAAAAIIRDNGNLWMTTKEIKKQFDQRGKGTLYNAIDMTLKKKSEIFELRKENNRNEFRLRLE